VAQSVDHAEEREIATAVDRDRPVAGLGFTIHRL
jgi:hypothetical protein